MGDFGKLLYFRPKPLIKEVHSCELSQIVYRGEEITDKTVYEDVLQVLSRYKSRASLKPCILIPQKIW